MFSKIRSSYRFYNFKFPVFPSQIAVTLLPIMSGPQFTRPQSLDYHTWGPCWSVITSCNRTQKTVPELKDAPQLLWSALSEEATDNAVKGTAGMCRPTVDILNI